MASTSWRWLNGVGATPSSSAERLIRESSIPLTRYQTVNRVRVDWTIIEVVGPTEWERSFGFPNGHDPMLDSAPHLGQDEPQLRSVFRLWASQNRTSAALVSKPSFL